MSMAGGAAGSASAMALLRRASSEPRWPSPGGAPSCGTSSGCALPCARRAGLSGHAIAQLALHRMLGCARPGHQQCFTRGVVAPGSSNATGVCSFKHSHDIQSLGKQLLPEQSAGG